MTNNKKIPEPEPLRDELTERGREVWLAGLGALATVEEEGSKLFTRLINRGREFEEERRDEIDEAKEKARERRDEALAQLEEAGEETQSKIAETVNNALERFGVPTQKEVDRLSARVEALSQQVEDLATALSETEDSSSTSNEA